MVAWFTAAIQAVSPAAGNPEHFVAGVVHG